MNKNAGGRLAGACCYLSGPMEFAADNGISWRRKFIDLAYESGLNIDFIDPTNKPGSSDMKFGEDKEYQINLQQTGRFMELKNYVANYRRFDLRFVDLSDFLVAVIDPTIHMCGTYNEIFLAEQQHKPMFFICEGGLKKLPRWLFDVIDLTDSKKGTTCNVFDNLYEVIHQLKLLNNGTVELSDKWVLIRKYVEQFRDQNPNRGQSLK